MRNYPAFLIFTLIFSVSSLCLKAQYFNGGVVGGIVASQVAGDGYSGFHKAGIYGGGFVNIEMGWHTVLQMEMEYYQKGSRHNPQPEKGDYTSYLFRANYVELPVMYFYKVSKKFRIGAGPSFGILINYKEENESGTPIGSAKPSLVTFQVTAAVNFKIARRLRVDFRTNNSILNIRSENRPGDVKRFFDYGQYHDSLVLSLYYQFKNDRR